jgi:hypothetical protein
MPRGFVLDDGLPTVRCAGCGIRIDEPDRGLIVYSGDDRVTSLEVQCSRPVCGLMRGEVWGHLGDFIDRLAKSVGVETKGNWRDREPKPRKSRRSAR